MQPLDVEKQPLETGDKVIIAGEIIGGNNDDIVTVKPHGQKDDPGYPFVFSIPSKLVKKQEKVP